MIRLIRNNIKGTVWKFYAFSFLTHVTFFSAVLIPFFTQWGNISLFQVQLLQSWFMLCIFVLEVPTGAIADFFGRKTSLILGCLLWIIGALVYGSIPNFYIFLLGEFILAFGTALISGADSALLYDSLKELDREGESKKYFGRVHTMELIAMMVSAALGSLLAARFGVNSTMLLTSIPFVFAVLVMWTIKEPKTASASEKIRYLQLAKDSMKYFYTHKTLRLIALDAIIVASAAYFVIWLYQSLLTGLQVPITYFGFAHAFLVGVQILISSNFVVLEKIFGSGKNFLRFSAGATAATLILAAVWPNIYTVFLLLIFCRRVRFNTVTTNERVYE